MLHNALTVDVEDYFHVSAFSGVISPTDWERYPLRVESNTQRLLDLFDEKQVKATFFVLGWLAEHTPGLIREIAARGHEVACHGYSHQIVYKQKPRVFREETLRSKALLEESGLGSRHGGRTGTGCGRGALPRCRAGPGADGRRNVLGPLRCRA